MDCSFHRDPTERWPEAKCLQDAYRDVGIWQAAPERPRHGTSTRTFL